MSASDFMPRMQSQTRAMTTMRPLSYRRVNGAIADVWNIRAEASGGGSYVSRHPRIVIFLDDAPPPIEFITPDGDRYTGTRAFFIPADVPLSGRMMSDTVMAHLDIHLYTPSLTGKLRQVASTVPTKPVMIANNQTLLSLGRLAAQEVCDPRRANMLLAGLIDATLAEMFTTAPEPTPNNGGLSPHQLQRIDRYLHANVARQVSINELADLLGLSNGWFAHAFKASRGVSPGRWQADLRLQIATRMINEEHASLAEIAHATGFADQAHLSRRFTAHHGTSPSRWRRKIL